jgi:hypothetical protein
MDWFSAKGKRAAELRKQKFELVKRYHIPEDLLPGSLVVTYRRCGKATCRCVDGAPHPMWQLTYMKDGQKRVEAIPADWADQIVKVFESGKEYRQAVAEVSVINAELLTLFKQEKKKRPGPKKQQDVQAESKR